jgi:hypothetical protein
MQVFYVDVDDDVGEFMVMLLMMTTMSMIAALGFYIVYYIMISYIVNRKKYETMLGKFIVLPGSAAAGAFTGYKLAQIISNFI